MYEQKMDAFVSGELGSKVVRAMEPPRDLIGAHGKLASATERLQKLLESVSAITNQMHGPSPSGGTGEAKTNAPGIVGAFHDIADDCHRLITAVEVEVSSIRAALGD